ncbi:MAG: Protein phosphatase methylesterase 1 [Watsoniomyces obsoletus]|nr:MAG: Protein phosphatase methylesterase 1 [Watsoniomyces obsoletus]
MADFFDNKKRAAAAAANGSSSSKPTPSQDDTRLQPWVEKYRPKTLSDVAAQDHTINVLQRTLQASNLPHMLFYGPPGTGKTSTVLALAKELYGPDLFKTRVLELNASDERGISIVREKVKNFARMQLSNPPAGSRSKYPCPPFKIIILDEADSMTQDAQSALRRTMETYSKITRFCLICNYVTRIIDPLASRCSKFRFKSLDQGNAKRRLEEIAEKEEVLLEDGAVETLIRCSEGDLRKAITYLQSAARLVGAVKKLPGEPGEANGNGKSEKDKDEDEDAMDVDVDARGAVTSTGTASVTVKIIEEIAGVIPDKTIGSLVQAMRPRGKGAVYESVAKVVNDMVTDGWSGSRVITQLYQEIIFSESIPDKQKNKIVMVFSEIDKRLVDGADEHLEILDLALRISDILAGM